MTTIGYATLQIIPSLQNVSDSVNKQLGGLPGMGKKAGQQLGSGIAAGVRASESDVKRAFDNHAKLADRAADATGKLRTAEAQLQQLRRTGANDARITAAEERAAKARRDEIRLVNDTKTAYRQLEQARANPVGGQSFLSKFVNEQNARDVGTKVGRTLGLAIGAAATAGIAGIGYTLAKGFERLQSIDQATFKLRALGHSADETKQIMDNALASVKGTSFGLADAATAAASAVAAGIKPGQDLTKYLSEVGDAAAVAGTNFTEMGAIFNKIQTSNKAYTDDLQQLSDRGLPIFQWLQEEYGVTGEALSKMVQGGEVDAAHFQHAIETHIGGAALTMGQSFSGAVDNMEASVARLGANFLTAILGGDTVDPLAGPIEAVQRLTEKFDQIGVWVVAHGPQIHQFFVDVGQDIKTVWGFLADVGGLLAEHPRLIWAVVGAFAAWKTVAGVASLITSLQTINTLLRTEIPASATIAATSTSGAGAAMGTSMLAGFKGVFTVAAVGAIIYAAMPDWMRDGLRNGRWPGLSADYGGIDSNTLDHGINPILFPPGPASSAPPSYLPPNYQNPVAPGTPDIPPVYPGLNPTPPNFYKQWYPGRASGGPIFGSGPKGKDSVPIWAAPGEHVFTAGDVDAMGGQANVYAFRQMLHRAGGGFIPMGNVWPVDPKHRKEVTSVPGMPSPSYDWGAPSLGAPPDSWWTSPIDPNDIAFPDFMPPGLRDFWLDRLGQRRKKWKLFGFEGGGAVGGGPIRPDVAAAQKLVGTPYNLGTRFDCSGTVARVINAALGQNGGGLMSTKTAAAWLAARGFVNGVGGPGQISVGWYDRGPNPNDGHMAMTLSDGRSAEAGGSHGAFLIGGVAAGANSPQFDHHMYLPTVYGEDKSAKANADAAPPQTADAAPEAAAPVSGEGPASGGSSLPSTLSGLSAFGLDDLGAGVGKTSGGSDLSLFGKAAGAAVSGQVSSALGVLGVNDAPGWLKAATQLVGGIKVKGSDGSTIFDGSHPLSFGQGSAGSSAAPISATPTATGTMPPDDTHGARAGQPPGPVYNIRTATVEDAFVRAQRIERERSAAKLSRY